MSPFISVTPLCLSSPHSPFFRFGAPPVAMQDPSLQSPQGSVPGSGHGVGEGMPVQMKRLGEFTGIRPLPAASSHVMQGQDPLLVSPPEKLVLML